VCGLDHVDIVRSVSYCHSEIGSVHFDVVDNLFFVLGSAAVADSGMERQIGRDLMFCVKHKHLILFYLFFTKHIHPPVAIVLPPVLGDVKN
jgi:hypothetical protein